MKRPMIFTISLFMTILLSACSSKKTADAIVLPATEDMVSISIVSGDMTATCIDEEQIEEFMSILADMEPTAKSSVNDFPVVDDYVTINFNCSDDTIKTVFFYEDNGKQYVEQPYQGIYIPASALGARITDLLDSIDE